VRPRCLLVAANARLTWSMSLTSSAGAVTSPNITAATTSFRQRVAEALGPRLRSVLLFGSYATGRVHQDSDVDLLVLVDPKEASDGRRAVEVAVSVMLDHPEVVLSPLVLGVAEFAELRTRERLLALDIERDGISL
jgi:uncharacterized protein